MKTNFKIIGIVIIIEMTSFIKCFSQEWPKVFGENIQAIGYEILESYDKGFFICASTLMDGSHFKHAWIIKTDINGNLLWDKKFGDYQVENNFLDFDMTQDSCLIVCGATAQEDIKRDPLFIKLDDCGEIEWCKIYLSPEDNTATGIITLPGGGYLGMLQYYGGDAQHIRISLVKMDSSGEPQWIKHLAQEDSTIYNEEGYNLSLTPDSNYLVSGSCFNPSLKPLFIKTDTAGEQIWDIKWPNGSEGFANCSVFDSSSNIFSATGLSFPGTPRIPYLLKFSLAGEMIDQFPLMGDTIERGGAKALLLLGDTSLFSGLVWTNDPTYTLGYSDIIKTDTNGLLKIRRQLIDDIRPPTCINRSFDDKIIVIGHYHVDGNWDIYMWKLNQDLEDDTLNTQPLVYDSLCPYQIMSDTVELNCGLFVNIEDLPTKEEYESTIKISPNPASDWIVLSLPENFYDGNVEILIYNAFGQEVSKQKAIISNKQKTLNVSYLKSGIYFIRILSDHNQVFDGRLIKSE